MGNGVQEKQAGLVHDMAGSGRTSAHRVGYTDDECRALVDVSHDPDSIVKAFCEVVGVTPEQLKSDRGPMRPAAARRLIAVALRFCCGRRRSYQEIADLMGLRDTGAHKCCSTGKKLLQSGDQDVLLDFYRGLDRARQIGGY